MSDVPRVASGKSSLNEQILYTNLNSITDLLQRANASVGEINKLAAILKEAENGVEDMKKEIRAMSKEDRAAFRGALINAVKVIKNVKKQIHDLTESTVNSFEESIKEESNIKIDLDEIIKELSNI